MTKPKEWDWKTVGGGIEKRRLVLIQKAEVLRSVEVEVYEPDVWSIDGELDEEGTRTPGPRDIALTAACKLFMKEVTPKKVPYRSRVESAYKLIETYKELNYGGSGDTFVRDAFLPWLEKVQACTGVDMDYIWAEVMERKRKRNE
jgi:hypothetical protein